MRAKACVFLPGGSWYLKTTVLRKKPMKINSFLSALSFSCVLVAGVNLPRFCGHEQRRSRGTAQRRTGYLPVRRTQTGTDGEFSREGRKDATSSLPALNTYLKSGLRFDFTRRHSIGIDSTYQSSSCLDKSRARGELQVNWAGGRRRCLDGEAW